MVHVSIAASFGISLLVFVLMIQSVELFTYNGRTYSPSEVRANTQLRGGKSPFEGHVFLFGRPICDDGWGLEEARVVCKSICYSFTKAVSFGRSIFGKPSSANFIMDNVVCSGREDNIGACTHSTTHNCGTSELASVRCTDCMFEQLNKRDIELRGGEVKYFGNVYISLKPICDDGWTLSDAKVICRSLGRSKNVVAKSFQSSKWGNTDSDVFALDDVNCKGDERYITDCRYNPKDNCGKSEGAGVVCFEPDSVNLSPEYGDREGFVMTMNRPVIVVNKQWGDAESQVVCNQIYGSSFPPNKNVPVYMTAHRKVPQDMGRKCVISDVRCSGNETGIQHCTYDVVSQCPSTYYSVIVSCAMCADKDLISIMEQSLDLSGSREDQYDTVVKQLDQLSIKCRDWDCNGNGRGVYQEFCSVKWSLEHYMKPILESSNSTFVFHGSNLNYSKLLNQDLVKQKFSSVLVDLNSLEQQNSAFQTSLAKHFKDLSQYYTVKMQEVVSSALANRTGATEYLAKAKLSKELARQLSTALKSNLSADLFEQSFIKVGSVFLLREQKRRLIEEACNEITFSKGGVEQPFCTQLKSNIDMDLTKLINY